VAGGFGVKAHLCGVRGFRSTPDYSIFVVSIKIV
jgi:hypothetical protein